jgi:hypothetical protein
LTHYIRVLSTPELIHVIVRDELDLATSRRILADIAATGLAHPGVPVLVDTRAAHATMSVTDVYQLATELAESGVSHRGRLAVLNNPGPEFNRASFLEQLGKNRGLQFRHFHDYQATVDWLTGA